MKIKDLIEATNGNLINGNLGDEIGSFSKDTRIINYGDTYIGIKGENFDGNDFWKEALEKGAKTVIVQNINFKNEILDVYKNKNIILVEDTIKALADIAKYRRDICKEDFIVVGVTGSVGKTSTKDIIANVVSQKYNTLKTEGNNNNEIGLPLTLLRLDNQDAAVIEMGMNHLGEISKLTKIAKPSISVITNVGTSHIGNLGSRENILKAKLEILDGMEKKILVINNDNDLLHKFALENNDVEICTFGIDNDSDVMAEDIVLRENESEFICNVKGDKFKVRVPVGGIHFVYNALCAVTVGKLLKLTNKQIINGIDKFELTKKRMDVIELKNGVTIINDSYNASLESMKASIKYLSNLEAKRKIAVLGDMFELGDFSEKLHKQVGEFVANEKIDLLICSGEKAKFIVEEAIKKGMEKSNIYYFDEKNDINDFVKDLWQDGDVILFKASNGMRYYDVVDKLIKNP